MTEEEFAGRPVERKDTNPKDAVGIRKAPMSAVPAQPLLELGLAMMEGARKYGRHNYRVAGVRASVYYDAAQRHIMAWWEGEDIDPESGLPHLVKAMACLCVVRDSVIRGNWVDDRPPSMMEGWQQPLNKKAGDLIDRLPNSKDPYMKETTGQRPVSSVLTDYSTVGTRLTDSQMEDFHQHAAHVVQTKLALLEPSTHSHSRNASDQECIDPKCGLMRFEQELLALVDNDGKPLEA